MTRDVINSPRYRLPGRTFSQMVRAPAGARFLFVSGITARREDGELLADADIETQTRQVHENIAKILAEAGATLDDVLKTTTYLTDISQSPRVSAMRRAYFTEPHPASTTVGVSGLVDPRMLIEMDAIAAVPRRSTGMRTRRSEASVS